MNLRDMPREMQVEAYKEGLIPFVPADAEWVPLDEAGDAHAGDPADLWEQGSSTVEGQ